MKVFAAPDYRAFIRHQVAQADAGRGYMKRMAEAAGCQASYLSQVLRGSVQLTPDHAAGLCRFWGLDALATEYFLALVESERASSRALREILGERLASLRRRAGETGERLAGAASRLDDAVARRYYGAWYYGALHMLAGLPGLDTAEAMAQALGLPAALVTRVLGELESMGLVAREDRRWRRGPVQLYVTAETAWCRLNHLLWRQTAAQKLQEDDPRALHYTGLYALGKDDVARIKKILLDAIEDATRTVERSPEETLAFLVCDFLPLLSH